MELETRGQPFGAYGEGKPPMAGPVSNLTHQSHRVISRIQCTLEAVTTEGCDGGKR